MDHGFCIFHAVVNGVDIVLLARAKAVTTVVSPITVQRFHCIKIPFGRCRESASM